jgi:glycosyltransferase involved in cell wall biosynthesis
MLGMGESVVVGTETSVSVIIPCRNEVGTIRQVLDDLQAQTWQGSYEVVIADGGSQDGTRAVLDDLAATQPFRFRLQVIDNPAGGIPSGLNAAVRASRGRFIVRVDGHCRVTPEYVARMVHALAGCGHDVVGPRVVQIANGSSWMAGAIAALLGSWLGSGGTPSRGSLSRSVRVAHTVMSCYRREVWEYLGGYDELLASNEDFDFDYRATRAGAIVASLPEPTFALVSRANIGDLLRQRWRYGWWKAAVISKFPHSLHLRQLLPFMFFTSFLLLVVGGLVFPKVGLVAGGMLAVYALGGWYGAISPALRRRDLSRGARCVALVLAPVIFTVIHGGWAAGLIYGLLRNRYRGPKPDPLSSTLIPRCRNLSGQPRVAVVHDWLETCGGSEQVLAEIIRLVPDARLFSLVDFRDQATDALLQGRLATTSPLQRVPGARRCFRWLLPFMPMAIEQLNLKDFDVVISSSHAVAKGVIVRPYARHICYCHSPLRYAWDQQFAYDGRGAFGRGLRRWMILWSLHGLRVWDVSSSLRVDRFVANSSFVAERIARYYRRESAVIHPPVHISAFPLHQHKGNDFVVVSRLVPYKRIDIVIEAFNRMPQRTLVVVGSGPEQARLMAISGPNIRFTGFVSQSELVRSIGSARAFVFAAEEDFGIAMVEAMASGTPVIAYASGGSIDVVIDGVTGILVEQQTSTGFAAAIERFESIRGDFDPATISAHAQRFSAVHFHRRLHQELVTLMDAKQASGMMTPWSQPALNADQRSP